MANDHGIASRGDPLPAPAADARPIAEYPLLPADIVPELAIRRAEASDMASVRTLLLASLDQDFGYGYVPAWHWDVDRLVETYVDNARQAMFIAAVPVGSGHDMVVATAGVRIGGPTPSAVPDVVATRYTDRRSTAQLVRVVSHPGLRRTGIARRLVDAVVQFVRNDGGYRVICLHTNALVPGAVPFWRSTGFTEILDERTLPQDLALDSRLSTVHFELPLR